MAVQFFNEIVPMPAFDKSKVKQFIPLLADKYGKKVGDVNYNFCSDERILEVNKQYLQHDYYTDIITFDYSEGNRIAGDIFVSVETVKSNADEYGISFVEELHRILFHGVLHLCGVNDQTPEERQHMIECENSALKDFAAM
ncbi:rRNA maturation RNase YbeY [Porphyromonadaceae bacterium]